MAARSTEGEYYPAHDLNLIQQQLQLLVNDLRGQYQLTYITLRRSGEYLTRIDVELKGVAGETEVGPFNVDSFYGADNQGVIKLDPPSFDRANNRATVFLRALHVPRNIDHIKFRVNTAEPPQVALVRSQDGGLLEGWKLSGPDADCWYEVVSDTPLEFGSLGQQARLTFSNPSEADLLVPIDFDDTIYTGGKALLPPSDIPIGNFRQGCAASPSERGGDRETNAVNGDGSGVTQLTHHEAVDLYPAWSPAVGR